MRRLRLAGLLTIALVFAGVPAKSFAQVSLTLSYDSRLMPNIVVPRLPFGWGDSIRTILQRDFEYSDRLQVLPRTDSMLAPKIEADYAAYSLIGARFVVQVDPIINGLKVTLHEVGAKKVAGTKDFILTGAAPSADWRFGLHGVADAVQGWILGDPGIAQSKIAYVQDGAVMVVDFDGYGARVVQRAASGMIMSPDWHPTQPALAFSELAGSAWKIGMKSLSGGATTWLTRDTDGSNLSPVFAPNGDELFYARQDDEGGAVWSQKLSSPLKRRITGSTGISSLTIAAQGAAVSIIYVDDKLLNPWLFLMGSDGVNPRPLMPFLPAQKTYLESPSWSPDGSTVAYQVRRGSENRYSIETIDFRTRDPKAVLTEGNNEDPAWGPNSQHMVVTSTRAGSKQLWIFDTKSGRKRQITFASSGKVMQPSWSPRGR